MEKVFKPRISKLFAFAVTFFSVVTVLMFHGYNMKKIPLFLLLGVIFTIVDVTYLLPNIFFTRYTFEEQYLVIREWPFRYTKVFYEDVVGFDDNDKNDTVRKAAMSFSTVKIGYYDDEDVKQYVEVSPKDFEMFLLVLSSRVKNFSDAERLRVERIARAKDEKHKRRQKYLEKVEEEKQIAEQQVRVLKVKGLLKGKGFRVERED
ncbi:MAG: hypothetical protein J5877_01745 [Clostridia bacterium]|nr:hypothetical protein [Clostridia bacterium]